MNKYRAKVLISYWKEKDIFFPEMMKKISILFALWGVYYFFYMFYLYEKDSFLKHQAEFQTLKGELSQLENSRVIRDKNIKKINLLSKKVFFHEMNDNQIMNVWARTIKQVKYPTRDDFTTVENKLLPVWGYSGLKLSMAELEMDADYSNFSVFENFFKGIDQFPEVLRENDCILHMKQQEALFDQNHKDQHGGENLFEARCRLGLFWVY